LNEQVSRPDLKPARSTVKGTVEKIGNLGEIKKKRKPKGEMRTLRT